MMCRDRAVCLVCLVCVVMLSGLFSESVRAGDDGLDVDMEWSGHAKIYGRALQPQSGTAFDQHHPGGDVGLDTNYDGQAEVRINNRTFFGDRVYTEVQWEGVAAGGDTREDGHLLRQLYPALYPNGLLSPPNDDRRLFDLTWVAYKDKGTMVYNRLDRAMVAWMPDWGEVRLGRQAVTWGHGFTFNPMDIFNPFAPTDLERDYKMGDDIALVQFPAGDATIELLYAARRDPSTEEADFDQSSLGTKVNVTLPDSDTNLDIVLTLHYKDYIAGAGAVGYLGSAAWRLDATVTFLHTPSRGRSAYLSAVANVDYSWVWLDKNWYGYVELYYNGLSDADYADHFYDPAIRERIARGELFALGELYASANVNVELHPLVNVYLTAIVNLHDPSGALLPRLVYDPFQDVRLTLQGTVNWGGTDTEYGGYAIPGYSFDQKPFDTVSAWLTWYF